MLKWRLAQADVSKGFLLVGFPRGAAQAVALDEVLEELSLPLDLVMVLDGDPDHFMERLEGRRVCQSCGRTYNIFSVPPRVEGACDDCGGRVRRRSDDNEETIANRMRAYESQFQSLSQYYKLQGKIHLISAEADDDVVFRELCQVVDEAPEAAPAPVKEAPAEPVTEIPVTEEKPAAKAAEAKKKEAPKKEKAKKKAAPKKKAVAKKAAPKKKAVAKKAAPKKKVVAKKAAPKKKVVAKKAAPKKKVVAKKAAPKKKVVAKKAAPKKKVVGSEEKGSGQESGYEEESGSQESGSEEESGSQEEGRTEEKGGYQEEGVEEALVLLKNKKRGRKAPFFMVWRVVSPRRSSCSRSARNLCGYCRGALRPYRL
ncbi:hypothetical protein BOW51_07365 [Solemya velesiana gill symbiont]|uniref:Adenylate kinase n=1 Tax=Solemya velesiana gill symbiont TaxID=1918948 RepID=A0A1T2KUK6_9GAMM|nr:hypothetical protein BOW51_07365 [Solemya velesiana gill symbiont]